MLGNVLAYGVTSKLTLFGVVPYFLDKDLHVATPMGRIVRGTAGFGDTKLFVRYTAYQLNRRGASLRIRADRRCGRPHLLDQYHRQRQ